MAAVILPSHVEIIGQYAGEKPKDFLKAMRVLVDAVRLFADAHFRELANLVHPFLSQGISLFNVTDVVKEIGKAWGEWLRSRYIEVADHLANASTYGATTIEILWKQGILRDFPRLAPMIPYLAPWACVMTEATCAHALWQDEGTLDIIAELQRREDLSPQERAYLNLMRRSYHASNSYSLSLMTLCGLALWSFYSGAVLCPFMMLAVAAFSSASKAVSFWKEQQAIAFLPTIRPEIWNQIKA